MLEAPGKAVLKFGYISLGLISINEPTGENNRGLQSALQREGITDACAQWFPKMSPGSCRPDSSEHPSTQCVPAGCLCCDCPPFGALLLVTTRSILIHSARYFIY